MFRRFIDSLTIKNIIIYIAGIICLFIFIGSFNVFGTISISDSTYTFSNVIYGSRSYNADLKINYLGINGNFSYSEAKNFPGITIGIIGYVMILVVGILILLTPKFFKNIRFYKAASYVVASILVIFAIITIISKQVFLTNYANVLGLDLSSATYVYSYISTTGASLWSIIAAGLVIYSNFAKDIYLTSGLHFYR